METVVGFVENERKIVESGVVPDSSTLSPNQIADPVVYKLVRVDGDGRFVPATDDEVMEVEDLLEDDKNEKVEDAGPVVGCVPTEGTLFGKPHVEISNDMPGLPPSETIEAGAEFNARLEYIEEVLQKVKQEERLRLACGSRNYASAYVNGDMMGSDQHGRLPVPVENIESKISLQEVAHSVSPSMNENHENEHGSPSSCLKHPDNSVESKSSDATCTMSKPDFSLLKGGICVDNLSIRELHECFRATFGRDTTVKDKSWLKRRIAMGLTNSCDIPASSCIIKEGKFIEESSLNVDGINVPTAEALNNECRDSPTAGTSENKDEHRVQAMELDHGNEDRHEEKSAVKRIRKPTRRYIEELSEEESIDYVQKVISLSKNAVLDGISSANSIAKPIKKVCSDGGRTIITRLDSFGGSGFHVPCGTRVRRSRPRKDIIALLFSLPDKDQNSSEKDQTPSEKDQCPSMMDRDEVEKSLESPSVMDTEEVGKNLENSSLMDTEDVGKNLEQKPIGSVNASDDNTAIIPTPKCGTRRKHHRAWTLVEVNKLVEGVSICGAGRWSEIKKLSFSSFSYRTSVDLKDKWRNLLKASFAQTPVDEGISSRKHASVSIPAQVLLRVRELAEMHAQVPPNHGQGKVNGGAANGSSMHEMSSAVCL